MEQTPFIHAVQRLERAGFNPTRSSTSTEYFSTCFRCHGVGKLRVFATPENAAGVDLWCENCRRMKAVDIPEPNASTAPDEVSHNLAPDLDDRALHGVLGDYVRVCAPHTEVAAAAILVTSLAAMGALIGRGPAWQFGDSSHHTNLFVLLVGPSGSGRKGGAISVGARKLLKLVDPGFYQARVTSGLSSAEGLIDQLRDATPDRQDSRGKVVAGDPGISDKRLLVIEGEFASVLEAMSREGNRLSAVLRDLWDGNDVRTMVKANPQSSIGAHVSIIGAITPVELSRRLGGMAIGNGLANRFIPVWATRSQLLAEDSAPDWNALGAVRQRLVDAIDRARRVGQISWSEEAQSEWIRQYATLAISDTPDPRLKALFERAAPLVRRLAMIYALLDGTGTVRIEHLQAALAVWRFGADSWRMVFAEADPRSPLARTLDEFIKAGGEAGRSRTQIRKFVASNDVPAERIEAALAELNRAGQIQVEKVRTGGRSAEVWRHARFVGARPGASTGVLRSEEREEREEGVASPCPEFPNPSLLPFIPLLPSVPLVTLDEE